MQVTNTNPGESMDIPLNTDNTADHNADRFDREQMTPGKNPVGNDKDCD